jgi:DNA-binding response OmpR family regulator
MLRILVVEDEPIVAKDISSTLKKLGHKVIGWGIDEPTTRELVEKYKPHVVFMDINLEEEVDGIEIAEGLRYDDKELKIIYLTAYADEATIDRAVKTSPSGYIVKPFNRKDLDITLKIALQDTVEQMQYNTELMSLGHDYYYDEENKNLFYKEIPIALTSKELKLFDICYRHKGKIVLHENIDAYVWSEKVVSESTRRGLHFRLRTKLNGQLFETVIGIGCRIL